MSDRWLAVRVHPERDRDGALRALFALGAQAVEESGDALLTQFPESVGEATIAAALQASAPSARVEISVALTVDWSLRWRESITSHDLGAITVAPPWLADGLDPARTVVIEPEMAFGTGEHATTRGVLRLLPAVLRRGDAVADLGAGSAVLAIAAAKLGARRVAAIELDPDAIGNAEENVRRNGVEGIVTVIEGDAGLLLPLVTPIRVITANIISSVLESLLPVMAASLEPDGAAILSGILVAERDAMLGAFDRGGWRVLAEEREGEDIWWTTAIARP